MQNTQGCTKIFDRFGGVSFWYERVKKEWMRNFVDKNKKILSKERFDRVWDFTKWYAKVKKGNAYNLIDQFWGIVSEVRYDEIESFSNIKAKVKKNGTREMIVIDEKMVYLYDHLKHSEFQQADKLFKSQSIKCIIKNEYQAIKKQYFIQHLKTVLKQFDFQQADTIFQNQWIECITEDEYKILKSKYQKKLHTDTLIKLCTEHRFHEADNFYTKQTYWLEYEYIKIKKQYFIPIIENNLSDFNFTQADTIFENQWIECMTSDEYIEFKKEYIKKYFKDENCKKLNDEKYKILADMSQYTLVKARAGTGKSTVLQHKILFLCKAYNIDPTEIVLFAFNSSTADDMNEKVQQWIENKSDLSIPHFDGAMTFHRFAGQLISLWRSRADVVSDRENAKNKKSGILNNIVKRMIDENQDLKSLLYQYFEKEIDAIEKASLWMNQHIYYDYIKDTKYEWQFTQETLHGEVVKSVGEKRIADFLFEHGIEYKYERSIYANRNNWLNETYQPDFILTEFETIQNLDTTWFQEQDIPGIGAFASLVSTDGVTWLKTSMAADWIQRGKVVIEHRWIGTSGEHAVPWWRTWTWQDYRDQIEWKRVFLARQRYALVETSIQKIDYHSPTARSDFENYLKQELEKIWIICEKLPMKQLIEKVYKKHQSRLADLCSMYITKAKQLWWTSKDLSNKFEDWLWWISQKSQIFYKFANIVYQKYEEYLLENELIDMEDVLTKWWNALQDNSILERKTTDNTTVSISISGIKYVLVDEYQDCNRLFFLLLQWIIKHNPSVKLICVGDDWQLINSFAGSRIEYFRDFQQKYNIEENKLSIMSIQETFRCPDQICQLANQFYGQSWWSYSNITQCALQWYALDSSIYCYIENNTNKRNQYDQDSKFFPKKKVYKRNKRWELLKDQNWHKIPEKDENWDDIYEIDRKAYNMKYARYMRHLYEICKSNFWLNKIYILSRFKDEIFWSTVGKVKKQLKELLKQRIIDTRQDIEEDAINDLLDKKIHFMSMHKSKWKEADLIILLEIWTKKFPFLHPDNELNAIFGETIEDVLEEEKRLFYVALTRTKNKLYYISEKGIPAWNDWQHLIDSRGNA